MWLLTSIRLCFVLVFDVGQLLALHFSLVVLFHFHINRLFWCLLLSLFLDGNTIYDDHDEHIIGHFGDDFYRPDDQTNSVKALKETSWSSRSGLNPTRTTPPCYSNTTLGNHLYAQRKGPSVTNPICWTCNAHISVLLTVNIVSHNPTQSSSDNIPS